MADEVVTGDSAAIAARVRAVRERIAEALRRAGRPADAVRLVAATKTQSVERIAAVIAAGVGELGENRAQELVAKAPELVHLDPTWHFIGRLQRNKINQLLPWVQWWQSIDRAELVDALGARTGVGRKPVIRVLVEVQMVTEAQKGGCTPAEAPMLVDRLREGGLGVAGLMTVAPAKGDPAPVFGALRELAERLELTDLSMGMSGDFEVAIAEGATIVRIGTGLFGPRPTFPQFQDAGR